MTRTVRQNKADSASPDETMNKTQDALRTAVRTKREITYNTKNPLEIPVEVAEKFAAEGFKLRWNRVTVHGQTDHKQLNKRLNQGFSLLMRSEIPEMGNLINGLDSSASDEDFILLGDLALMKISLENAENASDYSRSRAVRQDEAIRSDHHKKSVVDGSQSKTTGGGQKRNFASDKK